MKKTLAFSLLATATAIAVCGGGTDSGTTTGATGVASNLMALLDASCLAAMPTGGTMTGVELKH
ncbi:hypothetical protein SGO26_27155 [Cupriavidus metallidurans]|uniref:hypothetical protein n=1 Tax=Cupriavidus TaxID=106589 RepID=UPI0002A371B4|nr:MULTISPECIES: hypothetical protein [Cupriavidus]EKZ95756.1 hypothetical protein D769_28552 [Cupriavidus sp. HMR-1]GMG92283.1 hypothetical protein Cmtc_35030 [Cupriavidus sp. TKC]HBD35218.1 hypothetical protein [Cupriavidus sp.]HBO83254.1 hypothetical protein [Cupriavidus sp.]